MSASRKVVERRCLKLINSDYTTFHLVWFPNPLAAGSFVFQSQMGTLSTFHLVLTISNVFQKMYRIVGGDPDIFERRAKVLVESYQDLRVHHPSLPPDLHPFQVMII